MSEPSGAASVALARELVAQLRRAEGAVLALLRPRKHDRWCVDRHDESGNCLNVYPPQSKASTDERTGDQVNDVVEETGVNLGKEYGWECADCDTVSGLRWDTQHMAEGSLAIHRVNEHATCDHCHQTLTRSPWKEGGYWKGKDHTSDCPGNPRGHAVKGKTR